MKRRLNAILCFAVITAGSLLILQAHAIAQTISTENSLCQWMVGEDGVVLACPAGDGPSHIRVDVLDDDSQPVVGATVYLYINSGCTKYYWYDAQVTDVSGVALLYPFVGLQPDENGCCEVSTEVWATAEDETSVKLLWEDTSSYDTREWRSFDLDANGFVNGVLHEWGDAGIFSPDYMTSTCRSDFNGDGQVGMGDYAMLTVHAAHPALIVEPQSKTFDLSSHSDWQCQTFILTNMGNVPVDWQLTEDCSWLTLRFAGGDTTDTLAGTIIIPPDPEEPPNQAVRVEVEFCVNLTGVIPGGNSKYGVPLTSNSEYPRWDSPDVIWIEVNAPDIDWAELQRPAVTAANEGVETENIFGQVRMAGVTDLVGQGPGIMAQLGYGPDGTDPLVDPSWQWVDASFNLDAGDNDEYVATLTVPTPGDYDYCYRFAYYGGVWQYGDLDGSTNGYSIDEAGSLEVNSAVGVLEDEVPTTLRLHPAQPNPFNPVTTIRYDLPEPGRVVLRVFDLSGRVVCVLKGGVEENAGNRQAVWNGLDDSGRAVASGVYLCRLEIGDFRQTNRLVLVR